MDLSDAEQRVLTELATKLRTDLGAVEVWLYGSAARGELEEGSDLDMLVVFPSLDWETEKKVVDLCFQAELQCRRVISAACFSEEELTQTPLRASPFVLSARRDATEL